MTGTAARPAPAGRRIPARSVRVGLDIGGTKTDAVALDDAGEILAHVRRVTGQGGDAVVGGILEAIRELSTEAALPADAISSVGVGIPGLVETGTGRVVHAVNLGVESLDLRARVGEALGVPFAVENDVKAAALGAAALTGHSASMAYLNLGTGVAAGIVIDGGIRRGAHGTAGEVGHISIDPAGALCACGQRGCIETMCGGGQIARAWGRPGALPVRDVFDAADAGDERARSIRSGVALGAAAAVRVLALSVDVDRVVIGGGLSALGARLEDDIRAALREEQATSPFLRSLRLDERIELLTPGSPAAALGAALVGHAAAPKEIAAHG